ncbi:MAG: HD domain-containing protein [Lachnospiraceae bacterium]|nr:HD domain-containing protein [Lachnospiraceae bacterium]
MEEAKKKQSTLGMVLEGIFVVVVLAVLLYFVLGQIALPREMEASYERCEPFEAQWEQVFEDGSREPVEVPGVCKASPGVPFVIETTLGDIEPGSALSFYSLKQDMKVYVGGELRTEYSTKDSRIFGNCSPRYYVFTDICEVDSGKSLRVELVSESAHAGTLKSVYYGDKAAIWRHHIKGNLFSLCITAFVWIISVIAIIACSIVRFRIKKELSILYFGWSMFLLSNWLIAQSDIRQLLFKNISVVGDVAMACSTLFLMPLAMYFNVVFGKRYQKECLRYEVLVLVNCLVSNALVLSGVVDSAAVVPFIFILLGIGCVILARALWKDWKLGYVKDYKYVLVGFSFLILAGVVQTFTYFYDGVSYAGGIVALGVLFTLLSAIVDWINKWFLMGREKRRLTLEVDEKNLKVEKLSYQAMETLAHTIDAKDNYTSGHSTRVAKYAREIARRLGMDEQTQNSIYFMGLLHDIGKIGIKDDLINKPGSLTDEEFFSIKRHSTIGYDILRDMSEITNIEKGARWHHERYDGKGYPDGLKGEEIPEYARIICVADAYDAMTSKRSYRDSMPQAKVREEIEKGRGTQFDPRIADVILSIIDEDTEYRLREDA